MKFTYNWLKEFLDTKLTAQEIAIELTKLGLELKECVYREDLLVFKVAHIIEAKQHPSADKLKLCIVDDGANKFQIVCGAQNARAGIKVVLAPIGAVIPNGKFTIKSSEIRGEKSEGMLCSRDELLIPGASDGIIELQEEAETGSSIMQYLGLEDVMLEVEITPNRSDCFGVYGIARDLAAKNLGSLRKLKYKINPGDFEPSVQPEIQSSDVSIFALREFRNIKNKESPEWLQNFLKNIGMEPISAIVDITNYINISYSMPMHAYDATKISGNLVARNLENPYSLKALNGKTYELSPPDIVISDNSGPLGLAGIIGGESSKCSNETNHIVLEAAIFDKVSITKTGRKHNILTDARARFERGVDHNQTLELLEIATNMILDICGGQASKIAFSGKAIIPKRRIEYNLSLLAKRIAIEVSKERTIQILEALGFEIEDKGDSLILLVPSWRHDVNIPEVIAEEIARIIGYENISMTPLPINIDFEPIFTQKQRREEEVKRLVASLGYNEAISWSFMPSNFAKEFTDIDSAMKLENPISVVLDYMRPSIVPNLLEIVSNNIKRSATNLAIFELGPIFNKLNEETCLTALIYGEKIQKDHATLSRDIDFFDIKSDLERIIIDLGFNPEKLIIEDSSPRYYHPGRSATLKLGKEIIAYLGEIHPSILSLYNIKSKICIFELFIEKLPVSRSKNGRKTKAIFSQFQKVSRDFAFILDLDIKAGEILRSISSLDKIIIDTQIFDLYEGSNVPDGKKSIALRVSLQSDEKTLLDEEIEIVSRKIIEIIQKKFSGELRSSAG